MNRITVSLLFLISSFCFFSCKPKPPVVDPAVPVNLMPVKAQTVLYYDKYPSTTQALSQVDLRPQVQGYITGIYFKEGSHVKKGQILYEIDKRIYQANYDAAAANLKIAQGSLDQAKQDADRYNYLNSYDAIAKQVLDHAVIAQQNAASQVRSSEEAVNAAKTNLAFSTITAPFDGTIGFSQVKLGNTVTPGTTVVNTISTDDPMAVDFLVNEKQLMHYEDLLHGKGKEPDSLFTILMPDNSVYPFPGKISVIDRSVDPLTGTLRIRLVFPNPQSSLRAGMSCIVRVHNQEIAPQILIPSKAVVEQMGEYFVFVVKDTIVSHSDSTKKEKKVDSTELTPRPHAFQKKVMVGQTIGPNVIIKSGLEEGEQLVIDGIQSLHDGTLVTTANKKGPQQEGGTKEDKKEGDNKENSSKATLDKNSQGK